MCLSLPRSHPKSSLQLLPHFKHAWEQSEEPNENCSSVSPHKYHPTLRRIQLQRGTVFTVSFKSAFLILTFCSSSSPFQAYTHLLSRIHPTLTCLLGLRLMLPATLGPAIFSLNYTYYTSSLLVKKVKLIYILFIIWCLNDAFYPWDLEENLRRPHSVSLKTMLLHL